MRERGRIIAALLIAGITLTSAVLVYTIEFKDGPNRPSTPTTPENGPAFDFAASYRSAPLSGLVPAPGAWVTVFGAIPDQMTSSNRLSNTTENGEIMLYQAEANANGISQGDFFSQNWSTISSEWPSKLGTNATTVSLLLESSFISFDNATQQWDVYTFSDAIPFDPWSPPSTFTANAYFDLSHPAGTLAGLPPPLSLVQGGGRVADLGPLVVTPSYTPCGQNPAPTWTTNYEGYITGPFPILMTNNTKRTVFPAVENAIVSGEEISGSTLTINFTGASAEYVGTTYTTTAGAQTTWGAHASLSIAGGGTFASSVTTNSFGMLYVDNVTIHLLRQTETAHYYTQPYCKVVSASYQDEWTSITNVTDNAFYIRGESVGQAYGQLINEVTHRDQQTVVNLTTGMGSTQYWAYMMSQAQGTTNAEGILSTVLTDASYFMTALDIGLSVMDLAGACGFVCEAADVADTISLLGDAVGLFASIESAISSFSYTVSTTENLSLIQLTANDNSFHFQVVGSASVTAFPEESGSGYACMPIDVIGW